MRRILLVALLIVVSCSPTDDAAPTSSTPTTQPESTTTSIPPTTTTTVAPPFGISSPSFEDGRAIPRNLTCDGADASPGLSIVGIPESAESLVLIVDDPDAPLGTWDHWVEFDIPVNGGSVEVPPANGAVGTQGVNSWNLTGYKGPCPPDGEDHQYFFTVYALDTHLDLPPAVDSDPVYSAMEGHVLSSVELTGTYGR